MKFKGQEVVGFWSRNDGKIYCWRHLEINEMKELNDLVLITLEAAENDKNMLHCSNPECKKLLQKVSYF